MYKEKFWETKSVNIYGRLGSLYDAVYNKPVDQYLNNPPLIQGIIRSSTCKLLPFDSFIDLSSYLKTIEFNSSLQLSVLLCMIKPRGISSILFSNQSIDENVRFLYYSYINKQEKLHIEPNQIQQIIQSYSIRTRATHMITEIRWGFEILFIIQKPERLSTNVFDNLLNDISRLLNNNQIDFIHNENYRNQLNQLTNVDIYGSEICIQYSNMSFTDVMSKLIYWQKNEYYHYPLNYTMLSLNDFSSRIINLDNQATHLLTKVRPILMSLDKIVREIEILFENISNYFLKHSRDQQWVYYQEEFCAVLNKFFEFRKNLKKIVIHIRRNNDDDIQIDKFLLQNNHLQLEHDFNKLHSEVLQWFKQKSLSISSKIEINVLMLGETGVGKSTFINAFVNYLVFDSLQQAEQSKPVALIPVSFLTTTGHNFDEIIVKFGDIDENEDFEHDGQSVTQQCKSYVFDLNDQLRLRLIDTPGINDTRGIDQDNKNMEHILTYVNNLSHLNAVCLLLKPDNSKLTTFFRSCINQLFTYLTPMGYENIIFCFTNARSTFFTPGNTGSVLRQMLANEYQNMIPFTKQNTFCFDSESFRYLAARKCHVEFEDFQKQECRHSWNQSVIQSNHLLQYILNLKPYYLNDCQSVRKTILNIMTYARPLMETLRLILYNLILNKTKPNSGRIEFKSFPLNVDRCFNCMSSHITKEGPFCFIQYSDKISTEHISCSENHTSILIEYILRHEFIDHHQNYSEEQLHVLFHDLLQKCVRLSYFIRQQNYSTRPDPFLSTIEQFIIEEQKILFTIQNNLDMNTEVQNQLNFIKDIFLTNATQPNENCSLDEINQILVELKDQQSVQIQLKSITENRRLKMEFSQRFVNLPSMKNKRFTYL